MNQEEFDYWREITVGSSCRWQEDTITRLNGRGALYYCGIFNAAFQSACQLGGRTFLTDIFSNDKIPRNMLQSAQSTIVQADKLS